MNAIDIFDEVKNVPEVVSSNTISDNKMYGATKAIDFTLVSQDNGLIACAVYSGTG